jgi:hypothetical protein
MKDKSLIASVYFTNDVMFTSNYFTTFVNRSVYAHIYNSVFVVLDASVWNSVWFSTRSFMFNYEDAYAEHQEQNSI